MSANACARSWAVGLSVPRASMTAQKPPSAPLAKLLILIISEVMRHSAHKQMFLGNAIRSERMPDYLSRRLKAGSAYSRRTEATPARESPLRMDACGTASLAERQCVPGQNSATARETV